MIKRVLIVLCIVQFAYFVLFNDKVHCSSDDSLGLSNQNQYTKPLITTTVFEPDKFRPKIALVLSGGGARGLAQIGVLEELEKNGIKIDYIIGTSIGAVVGGLYSVGYSAHELDSIVLNANWNDIFSLGIEQNRSDYFLDQKVVNDRSLITLRFNNFEFVVPEAISGGTRFNAFLQKLIGTSPYQSYNDFDSLKYKFRAVTTDLIKGRTCSIKSGNLATAIRASATVPLRYTPVSLDSLVLVDGGLMANIPVNLSKEFNPDIVIAVNTVSDLLTPDKLKEPWNLADQVVSIMMQYFSQNAVKDANYVITPELDGHTNSDFENIDKVIASGKTAADKSLFQIKKNIIDKSDSTISVILNKIFTSNTVKKINLKFFNFNTDDGQKLSKFSGYFDYSSISEFEKAFSEIMRNENYKSIEIVKTETDTNVNIVLTAKTYQVISEIEFYGLTDSYKINIVKNSLNQFKNLPFNTNIESEIYKKVHKDLSLAGIYSTTVRSVSMNGATLKVRLDEAILRKIIIKGNKSTNNFLILRELNFSEANPVDIDKIIESWENLLSSELFNDVEMHLVSDSKEDGVDLIINVKEKGTQTVRLSGKVDNERNAQASLELIQDNLINIGERYDLRLAGGNRNQTYDFTFAIPRIFKSLYSFDTRFYYDNRNIYKYKEKTDLPYNRFERVKTEENVETKFGMINRVGIQIERKGKLSIEMRNENQRYYDINEKINPYYGIHSIKIGSIFDTEDRSDFPTEGRLLELSLETALFTTTSSVGFSKAMFYYRTTHSMSIHTLRASALFGFGDKTLPLPEFFSLGGQDNFFGMREEEERGRQIVLGFLEYRIKLPINIYFDTYFSLRYDLGAVWEQYEDIRFSKFKHGIGTTLSMDTPIGPAKFSIGRSFYFLKNPSGVALSPFLLYFCIGIPI